MGEQGNEHAIVHVRDITVHMMTTFFGCDGCHKHGFSDGLVKWIEYIWVRGN
jgi:hypothetical protein